MSLETILSAYTCAHKRKGAGTSSGESGARNLEAESIRSRVESTGGWVKLKTVTEIRRSSAHDIFLAERFFLYWILCWIRSQWRNWNRSVMWSVLRFFSMSQATVLYAMKALDRGSRQACIVCLSGRPVCLHVCCQCHCEAQLPVPLNAECYYYYCCGKCSHVTITLYITMVTLHHTFLSEVPFNLQITVLYSGYITTCLTGQGTL